MNIHANITMNIIMNMNMNPPIQLNLITTVTMDMKCTMISVVMKNVAG